MMDYEAERLEAEEIADLRAQVAALTANGVSMHKAAAAERAAVVAWLRGLLASFAEQSASRGALAIDRLTVDVRDMADAIERGDHHDAAGVAGSDAHGARNVAERNHGTGDVWAAIIAELPEGAARDLADQRRERGLETHGVPLPLRTLAQSLADRREELGDAAAYGAAAAVHKLLAGDEDGAIIASYEAGRHLQQGSGVGDVRVGYAMWRAVRRLARGVR